MSVWPVPITCPGFFDLLPSVNAHSISLAEANLRCPAGGREIAAAATAGALRVWATGPELTKALHPGRSPFPIPGALPGLDAALVPAAQLVASTNHSCTFDGVWCGCSLTCKTLSHRKGKKLASIRLSPAVGQTLSGVCGWAPSLCTVPQGKLLLLSSWLWLGLGSIRVHSLGYT